MINNNGPSIDPWGTPVAQEIYELWFLLDPLKLLQRQWKKRIVWMD